MLRLKLYHAVIPALKPALIPTLISVLIALTYMPSYGLVYIVDGMAAGANDANAGTLAQPFKTIAKAASILQPGDTCYIRKGTYRETLNPARAGTSETMRITYKAFPNEAPVLLGSEVVSNWTKVSGNIYRAEIPNSIFGTYNPFAMNLADPKPWIWYGKEYHLGDVYVNGFSYKERLLQSQLDTSSKSFFASVSGNTTTLWIHYGGTKTPASELIEINVRESIIRPALVGIGYITIDGLTIRHGASQWANCCDAQKGMIDFNGGRSWIVQNCRISDARTSAIVSPGGLETGHHLVRNNLIERCGQTGLAGNRGGWSFSIVEGNVIQDINMKDEFGGAETAAFKTHFPVDLTIRNNVIRRVRGQKWQFGIWLDVSAQGCRITGNVFSDLVTQAICLEVGHGPNLVDNNIFISTTGVKNAIKTSSQNTTVVHNLFFNSANGHYVDAGTRISRWYIPHTQTEAGSGQTPYLNDKYFNNIFIGGKNNLPQEQNYVSDFNVYFDKATPSTWGDKSSKIIAGAPTGISIEHLQNGINIAFSVTDVATGLKCPLITNAFLGPMPPAKQGLEHPDGSPIEVNRDIRGLSRSATDPTVGPFEDLKPGLNSYKILLNIPDSATGATAIYNTAQKFGSHKKTSQRGKFRSANPYFLIGVSDRNGVDDRGENPVGVVNVNGQALPKIKELER